MKRIVSVALPICLAGVVAIAPANASKTHQRKTLRFSSPQWADSKHKVRNTPSSKQVAVRVYLAPHNERALNAFVGKVSDPNSSAYGHYLNPAQYRSRFAPTTGDVARVNKWLTRAGLHQTGAAAGNVYVSYSGTAAAAERAFKVTLNVYRHAGDKAQAPAQNASVPASLKRLVAGVSGLNTAGVRMKPQTASPYPPPAGFRNAKPCSGYFGQISAKYQSDFKTPLPKFQGRHRNYAVCGYTPNQFRAAYGVSNTPYTGKGVTIAITDAYAAPTIAFDANHYSSLHGDSSFAPGQFTQSTPNSYTHPHICGSNGWYGEETLDVESAHGMAPDANIRYYGSKSCLDSDFLDTLQRVVDENKASIVTNSWGDVDAAETTALIRAYQDVFKQGAAQGIGFMFSSGDNGDEVASSGTLQTDSPASDPYVTAVGGTSLAVGPGGSYEFEAGWGTDKYSLSSDGKSWDPLGFLYGSGGGFSRLFERPAYQKGVVTQNTGRAVPDISLDGDPTTGMLIGETQTFPNGTYYDEFRLGGTSLSSPLFAGVEADAQQAAHMRLGFANPRIYQFARDHAGTYRDVTNSYDNFANVRADYVNGTNQHDGIVYSVRTFDDDSSLSTGPGWDDVTGVGSPKASFIRAGAGG